MTTSEERPAFRRAVIMMTATSFLVPAVGVITSPILARALGASGRGEMAAALAPAALILPVATLGLPDALTNLLARYPRATRPALLWATVLTTVLGGLCLLTTVLVLPFLSAGNANLANLIVLATALVIPSLVVGVFRGAAVGRQMWGIVAMERIINVALRLVVFSVLWLMGDLTLLLAVVTSLITPMIAGAVYWKLLTRTPHEEISPRLHGGPLRPLVSFGSKVWLGAVGEMLLGRIGQILMTPLSSSQDLGLYIVASTISDMPLIVAIAIQGALFGVNSKSNDAGQITTTARLTVIVGLLGCIVLGGSLPLWIQPLFGSEFDGAIIPTLLLLVSALICIPGLMAAAGLSAWKRPGLRSAGLIISLVANVGMFVLLVPLFGVDGACWTSILTNVVMTSFMVGTASRVMKVPAGDFLILRRSDFQRLWDEGRQLLNQASSRLPGRSA